MRLPRLGKRELILVLFVCLIDVLVWICRFPLPLDVWEGLWFVIVALSGLLPLTFFVIMFSDVNLNDVYVVSIITSACQTRENSQIYLTLGRVILVGKDFLFQG